MEDKTKLVVICGPTASGKTGLSIALARQFNGEIISADSMQIYKKLDIGTAKATPQEQAQVPHHLIDILEPQQPYNVQLFTQMAREKIAEITAKGKVPILVGGTGLYIESLINGVQFSNQKDNPAVKKSLMEELELYGRQAMHDRLMKIDPVYAQSVHPNNYVRVIRALELYQLTGKTMTQQLQTSRPSQQPYDTLLLALNFQDRQELYRLINLRVDIMMQQGLLEEAKYVYENRDRFTTCVGAIGYKEFFSYFDGTQTLEACIETLKQASRNYAKRQLTWFHRMQDIHWLMRDCPDWQQKAQELTSNFLLGTNK